MLSDFPETIQLFVGRAKIRILDQSSFHPTPRCRPPQLRCQIFWRGKTGNVSSEELPMSEHQAWHYKDGLTHLAVTTASLIFFLVGLRLQ